MASASHVPRRGAVRGRDIRRALRSVRPGDRARADRPPGAGARRATPERQAPQGEGAAREGRCKHDLGDLEPRRAHGAAGGPAGVPRAAAKRAWRSSRSRSTRARPRCASSGASAVIRSRWRCGATPSSLTTAASARRRCSTSSTATGYSAPYRGHGRPGEARSALAAPARRGGAGREHREEVTAA